MNCRNCSRAIENVWNYCPQCGAKARPANAQSIRLDEIFLNIMQDLKDVFLSDEYTKKAGNVCISMPGQNDRFQITGTKQCLNERGETNEYVRAVPKKTLEPKTETIDDLAGKITVTLKIPGTRSKKDIHIEALDESYEVRAHTKDKMFFKILKIPSNMTLKTNELKKGELKLGFGF